jgi:chaperone modulatory protein CbpM
VSYALVRVPSAPAGRRDLVRFARATGVHPDLVRRLLALGLLEPDRDAAGTPWFGPDQVLAIARVQRLRAGLGLNYPALGVVVELLDRIAELERQLRAATSRASGGQPWT